MVTLPAVEPVAVTKQLPDVSVQDDAENVTLPEPLCDQLTVPVGLEPATFAVQVLPEPTATLDGTQFTVVVVAVVTGPTLNGAVALSPEVPVAVTVYPRFKAPVSTVKLPKSVPSLFLVHVGAGELANKMLGVTVSPVHVPVFILKPEPDTITLVPARPEVGFNKILGAIENVAVAWSPAPPPPSR
jgi:hypothetical protein